MKSESILRSEVDVLRLERISRGGSDPRPRMNSIRVPWKLGGFALPDFPFFTQISFTATAADQTLAQLAISTGGAIDILLAIITLHCLSAEMMKCGSETWIPGCHGRPNLVDVFDHGMVSRTSLQES